MQLDATLIWVTTVMLAVIIFSLRNAFLFVPASLRPRGWLERALRYAPLSALAALVSPEILRSFLEMPAISWSIIADPRMLSALTLMIAVRLSGNALVGLLAGCGVFLIL